MLNIPPKTAVLHCEVFARLLRVASEPSESHTQSPRIQGAVQFRLIVGSKDTPKDTKKDDFGVDPRIHPRIQGAAQFRLIVQQV